jgi:hypothetical protein
MRQRLNVSASAAVAMVLASGSAQAGVLSASVPFHPIFGENYTIDIYRVAADLSSQGLSPAAGRLEPEGMVFHNGTLYVSGDGTPAETNGYLAAYAGGILSGLPTPQRFTVSVTNPSATAAYGPEGITVNTRGSGYGSFAGGQPTLVGVDNVISPVSRRVLAAMNTAAGTVDSPVVNGAFNYDDITFVPGADAASDRFFVIDASTDTVVGRFLSTSGMFETVGGTFPLPEQAKGVVFLSAADAALFSPLATGDSLLVAVSPDFAGDTNKLELYSLTGTLLASSSLPSGTGVGLFGNIESVAFDTATKRLFIGDENSSSSQIAVLTIPGPGAVGLGLVAGLAVARRRR